MEKNRKKEKLVARVFYQDRPIIRKSVLAKLPHLQWIQDIIDTPTESLKVAETAKTLSSTQGPATNLTVFASVACSYLHACTKLLDAIVNKVSEGHKPMVILKSIQLDVELKNSLTGLWEMLASYSILIQSTYVKCEEVEFQRIQRMTWICIMRLAFLLGGESVFRQNKKQRNFKFIDGHAFGITDPLPCDISSRPICTFGLKEIYTSCSILASSLRLACTDERDISGLSIDPAEVCEYIDTLACTYGSYLCFLPGIETEKDREEFYQIFNQAKFLDAMKQRPSPDFIEGMMAIMQPLYTEKLINELLRKNSASIRQGKCPSREEFLSFFTWLVHLCHSDMAQALRKDIIKTFPSAFVNSSHISVYRMKNSIDQKNKREADIKAAQVLLTTTPSLFDEVLNIFKSPLDSILKDYIRIAPRSDVLTTRDITLINSMRIAAQHIIMELLNTAVKNIKVPVAIASSMAMDNIRVVGGRDSTSRVTECGAPPGEIYELIRNSLNKDTNVPVLVESFGRFYLVGLPERAIQEYKTLIDGLYGYFNSLSDGSYKEIKKVISSAFTRYTQEDEDSDARVIAYRNSVLSKLDIDADENIEDALNSDNNTGKASSVLPSHRLGDLCSAPSDVRQDKTSAYAYLKFYTNSVSSFASSSAELPSSQIPTARQIFIYG